MSALFVFTLMTFYSADLYAWGAGMHASLTARAHEQMTARWKTSMDRAIMMYGSWGPDVWYILSDEFMGNLCPIACGGDNGLISNECWGRYENAPDRYFAWTRQLVANADSLESLSWAFGYGAHAIEDWRGHLEYIIPDWENPSGELFNRHTFIDSTGAALAFNVDGLYGYPANFGMDKMGYGYRTGGLLNSENAYADGGERDPHYGMSVEIIKNTSGRKVRWMGILYEDAMNLAGESISRMADYASLGSASEGILAARYGLNAYDGIGNAYPIIIENNSVAIDCSTNFRQRMESEDGYGYGIACQINLGAASGLAQWHNYLKPAAEEGEGIIVDSEKVALWMDRIANHYESGGTRMDDNAVFGINEETGLSEKHLYGVDDRDFTYGRSMPEIVDEVLTLSLQDIVQRLFENGPMLGTVLQSKLNPVDKARFVDFGFHYRPRLSAWPDEMEYEEQTVTLIPGAPGPFAKVQLPVDISPQEINNGKDLVFPYYAARVIFDSVNMQGVGSLRFSIAYRNEAGEAVGDERSFDVGIKDVSFPEDVSDIAYLLVEGGGFFNVQVLLDNTQGGWYYYKADGPRMAMTLQVELVMTDESSPPYDQQLDIQIEGYCDKPDIEKLLEPSDDNSACPLDVPDFPEEESEMEAETEGDGDAEIAFEDDSEATTPADGDIDSDMADAAESDKEVTASDSSDDNGGGCAQSQSGVIVLLAAMLFLIPGRRRSV